MANEEAVFDKAMFDEATGDKPAAAETQTQEQQAPQGEPEKQGGGRDERGRFAAKEKTEAEPAKTDTQSTEQEAQTAPPEKQPHYVPLAEHLADRERRQAAERERDELKRAVEARDRQFSELQKQLEELKAPKPEPIDPWSQPDQWAGQFDQRLSSVNDTVGKRLKEMEANFSFRLAHFQHKDVFEKGYEELVNRVRAGDIAIRDHIMASADPGQALVNWYRREQTVREVGEDPQAYVNRKMEEALKDPAFLAKAQEAMKAIATGQNGAAPRTTTQLPPSLTRAAGGSSANRGEGDATTDRSLFDSIVTR